MLLKRGDIVVHMSGRGRGDGGVVQDVWYHIAYVNMSSWEMSLLRLEDSQCDDHCTRVAPLKALQVPTAPTWACSHTSFGQMDMQLQWHLSVHTLMGDSMVKLRHFDVRYQQVLVMSEADLFWGGVPAPRHGLPPERREVQEALADGPAVDPSAPCPSEGDQGHGAGSSSAEVVAQADEDEAPMPDDDLLAVLEGVIDEMDEEAEPSDDMEVDLPVVRVDALVGTPGASSSSTSHVAGAVPGEREPGPAAASSAPVAAAAAAAAATVGDADVRRRGFGKTTGQKYDRSVIPYMNAAAREMMIGSERFH
jgi:hypothetical protein